MTWYRSASNLWDKKEERYIQQQLEQCWLTSEYPVHIYIVGAANTTAVTVQIFNDTNIRIIEQAYPEGHLGAVHPIATAAMAKVGEIINRLKELQEL